MKKKVLYTVIVISTISVIFSGVVFLMTESKKKTYLETPVSFPDEFKYTAHTGCVSTKDNSINSIIKGIENGAEIVEFDLHFDENNNPVLSHDTPVGGEVSLKEAFGKISEYPHIQVNVDIKSTANLKAIEQEAIKAGVFNQIFYTGVSDEFLSEVIKQTPNIPYYLNVNVEKTSCHTEEYLNSLVSKVKKTGAIGINFDKDNASKKLVDTFHKNGLLVSIYTVDNELEMLEIISYAPDNITTRNPDLLKDLLEKQKIK